MADQYLTQRQLSTFCSSMAMMLRAGVPMSQAAEVFQGDQADRALERAATAMAGAMDQGETFTAAAEKTGVFPRYALEVFQTGEFSGSLDRALERLADYYDRQSELNDRLRSSLTYPAILLVLMSGVLAVLVFAVLPMFERVYESLTGSLAASSYAYVLAASVIGRVSMILAVLVVLLLLVLVWHARSESGRQRLHRWMQRSRITGRAAWTMAVSQMADTLATLLSSGTDEDSALAQCIAQTTHPRVKAALEQCQEDMQQGMSLATALLKYQILSPLYGRMLVSAAESGNLAMAMERLAQRLSENAETELGNIIDRVEPLLIGFLTISVGLTLLSVMLPLLGMLSAV